MSDADIRPADIKPADAKPTATPRADVIHDIGYRHYDGPRLGRSYATRSLFVLGLRGSFGLGRSIKSKILPMGMLAVMCVPAVIIVAVAVYTKMGQLPLEYPRYLSNLQFVIAVFIASQAPVALSRDLRFMTLPLYFSRPLTSRDYVRAKFAAMFSAMFILTALPMLIMWIGSMLASMSFSYNLEHLGYGLVAAACYALVYSGIGLVISSLTPRRGFGVAAIIGLLLISEAVSGIVYGVLTVKGHHSGAHWAMLINPGGLVDSTVTWMFNLRHQGFVGVPSTFGAYVFIAEILVLALASYGLLVRRYRKI
ncbi:ABC transporter permease [Streptacidiphilus sp. EB129]|uniref:ABC transporter permease n=1 Tax=Streptacidiphilus sp. EB129 TaxID=3156262 RepID=UPI003512975E